MGMTYWIGGAILGLSGIYEGAVFKMNPSETIIIGRDPQCSNIIISDKSTKVSRMHCTVNYSQDENCYYICDHSKNGVFINNNERLPKDVFMPLPKGTIIEVGNSDNVFKLM